MTALPRPSRAGERIAIVSHVHPSISKGGAEISAYALFESLCALGRDAIFIAAVAEDRLGDVVLQSPREIVIPHNPSAYDHFYHLSASETRDALVKAIVDSEARIVNFQHFMNIGMNSLRAVAELPGVTTLVTLHEFLAICHNHGQMVTSGNQRLCAAASISSCTACFPANSPQQFAMRKRQFLDAFSHVDGFISPSRFLARRYVDWGIPADRMAVIENGLNHNAPPAPPRPRRTSDKAWIFGYFGRITPFKGLNTILDVADLLSGYEDLPERIKIRVFGNMVGQSEAFLTRFNEAVARHSFLTYAGPYDNRDVPRLMEECDYVLVPSIWWENSPVVIQEAFSVGRPVICSGIGGMAEKVIDGVSGLHFAPSDPYDLLRALDIAANSEIFAELSGQLPPVADAVSMANAYLEMIERWQPAANSLETTVDA